jgi:hypothetical protein
MRSDPLFAISRRIFTIQRVLHVSRILSVQFGLRRLLTGAVFLSVVIAIVVFVSKREMSARYVVEKVRSLNGSVGKNHPPDEISFSILGKRSLVRDKDLRELAPYLGRFGLRKIGLAHTAVGDSGLQLIISHCHHTLEIVSIQDSEISPDSLKLLTECASLQMISLSASQLSDVGINALASIGSLRAVTVHGVSPDDDSLRSLKVTLGGGVSVESYP